jgi:tetratricopeptide (TPR) repeat protein
VALYQQADQDEKANALLENARKQGLLQSENEFRALFIGYVNADKYKEAEDVLVDGVGKGVIKPSDNLSNDYSLIAQNYLAQDKIPQAVDFYGRAAKVATTGDAYLNLAKVLRNENRIGEAKAAAREALARGVKKPKEANDILALPGK